MTARILVVEDETDIAHIVLDYLRHAGYEAEHVADGPGALARLTSPTPPDLTLLDVMLPGLDGLSVLRQARRHTDKPIIMLTARVEEVDRLIGLELGADDYICKPFSPREVVARVKTVLRRGMAQPPATAGPPVLALDEAHWQVTLRGAHVALTPREFRLLQALARQSGRIFSRAQLLDLAYGDTLDVNERAIDSHIKNLRKKLKAASGDGVEWIRSVYGVGFAFDEDAGDTSAAAPSSAAY
ncbi:response regulator [Acidovorax sp. SUPP2522]|uniref:response regulator n=1 Tax=unclassified Acidovorax TaxID=2684926 RepID=UPI00234976AA|nr:MULTISPECIES: response regulator [unclassified Acidovorax]WCM96032.1 response regulator [Acidovorax sp. GBBC 1281]GKT18753.1 response regulator [Acidovorax sp. SUPP2522]